MRTVVEYFFAYLDFLRISGIVQEWLVALVPFLVLWMLLCVTSLIGTRSPLQTRGTAVNQMIILGGAACLAVAITVGLQTTLILRLAPVQNPVGWKRVLFEWQYKEAMAFAAPTLQLLSFWLYLRFSSRKSPVSSGAERIAAGVLAAITVLIVVYLWRAALRDISESFPLEAVRSSGGPPWGELRDYLVGRPLADPSGVFPRAGPMWVLLLNVIILSPIAEELFWRGLALPLVEQYSGSSIAILATSIVFGTAHIGWLSIGLEDIIAGSMAVTFGTLVGYAYVRLRSLTLCISIHVAWNCSVLVLAMLWP